MFDPISLIIIALIASAGTAAVLHSISWGTVSEFITSQSVRNGTARTIRTRLASGNYEVCTAVLSPSGATIASRTWTTEQIADDLATRFGGRNVIVVTT